MKKTTFIKTLLVVVCLLTGTNASWGQVLYSWEGGSPAKQTGGTIAATDGSNDTSEDDVNMSNSTYKVVRLRGAVDFSSNKVTITLDNTLAAGDEVWVTGYRNKNANNKTSGVKMKFNVGDDTTGSSTGLEYVNIDTSGDSSEDSNRGTTPNICLFSVPASAVGSNTITMTRSHTGTNFFITKIQVVRPTVNANIDFSNAITGTSPYTISGAVSSMTWTGQWTVLPSIDDGMLRVGNFTGTVTLQGDPANSKDIVTLSFDWGLVGVSGRKNMDFKIYDVDGTAIISEELKVYDQTFDVNTLNIDATKLVRKNADNPGMVSDTKNSFTIVLNYETKKISCSIVNKNGTFPYEIDMPLGTKAVGSFSVNANGLNNTHNYPNRRCYFDNLLIKTVVGDYNTTATITDAGWSTFASPYALDLSGMTASTGDVTAYYASEATGSTVTLSETTEKVPAGEGIMLKGTAGATITIPIAASGTAITGNKLKGQTTTGNVAASGTDGKYHYVFGYKKPAEVVTEYGFYNLASTTEVAAGKAYLETTTPLTAGARIAIVFEDETTGITSNKRETISNNRFFDLQGRKVAQPTKGLYIVNGKKVVVK